MKGIFMKHHFMFAGILLLSLSAYAKDVTPTQTIVTEDNQTKTERYCDPTTNADVMAKIKSTQNQMESLDSSDPNRTTLLLNIMSLNRKLKCINRPIPSQ
jgi:hypothetical protein